ncbi:MAG: 2-amino-4-hydroxy-6-hydroxymethyldihydropteridine diphosphokinase [Deltaproteobacteria bacterium]|nr:2-amino-4-hydroxy-6-hydroxymethyldihydropteridine diphosphokinase [Deltaproteobacteria bacterium]
MQRDDQLRAFVAVGGNLGDRLATLRSAVHMLGHDHPAELRVVGVSPIYETRPIGPSVEPFFNAVVELRTRCAPRVVLDRLLAIEVRHGRQRGRRWDARTLDLDLLLMLRPTPPGWVALTVREDGLQLPHPGLAQRDFVLVPLADLVGDEPVVDGRSPASWLAALAEGERTILRRVDEGLDGGELREGAQPGCGTP